jgi:hypothetical protein
MSHEAFMRWEWEGGTPAHSDERAEAVSPQPAGSVRTRPQSERPLQARRAATSSPVPMERRQADGPGLAESSAPDV